MTESLKTPKTIILPRIENVEDPEVKKVFEGYNRIFFELIPALYTDIARLHKRLEDLE